MPEISESKTVLSVRECAAMLGISERTLFSITSPRGSLKSFKIASRVFYYYETVLAWIKEQEQKTGKNFE